MNGIRSDRRATASNIAFVAHGLINESSTFDILFIFCTLAVSKQKVIPKDPFGTAKPATGILIPNSTKCKDVGSTL